MGFFRWAFAWLLSIVAVSVYIFYSNVNGTLPTNITDLILPVALIQFGASVISLALPERTSSDKKEKKSGTKSFLRWLFGLTLTVVLTSIYISLVWLPDNVPADYPSIVFPLFIITVIGQGISLFIPVTTSESGGPRG